MRQHLFLVIVLTVSLLISACNVTVSDNSDSEIIETESFEEIATSFYDSLPFPITYESKEILVDECYFLSNGSGYDVILSLDISSLPDNIKENLSNTFIGYFCRTANGEMLPSSYTKQFTEKIYIEFSLDKMPSSCTFAFMFDSRAYFECDSPSDYLIDFSTLPEDIQQMYLREYSEDSMRVINVTEIQKYVNSKLNDPTNPSFWSNEEISEVGTEEWQKLCSEYEEDVLSSAADNFDLTVEEIEDYYLMQFIE